MDSHLRVSDFLIQRFHTLYGEDPDILAQAPGRVNLIGEHIDYSDGFVLPFAIADHTSAAISIREDKLIRISSLQKVGEIFITSIESLDPAKNLGENNWAKYVLGVIFELKINSGLDILINGEVPLGAGLSSSAALECAVAIALDSLFALKMNLKELALAAKRAENNYVGMPCGIMDQSVSLMADEGSALLLDCRDLSTENVPFEIASVGLELLIIDTQAHHALVDGGYADRRASCEKAVEVLGIPSLREITISEFVNRKAELDAKSYARGLHAVTEMKRVLDTVAALKANDFKAVGELLTESHKSLRDGYEVSCPELNLAVDTSLALGALGARMVGGGFGGSAIALIQSDQIELTKSAIRNAFDNAGFKEPRFFTSLPSAGATII